MKVKTRTEQVIDLKDWDKLVMETYGRPYSFQQQDDCKDRGHHYITVPCLYPMDYDRDTVPEIVNHKTMGVSFKAWLERDPNQKLPNREETWALSMWWERNFYPEVDMIVNDLHSKGLLDAGEYMIDIDW